MIDIAIACYVCNTKVWVSDKQLSLLREADENKEFSCPMCKEQMAYEDFDTICIFADYATKLAQLRRKGSWEVELLI